jgi:hypothetical protein
VWEELDLSILTKLVLNFTKRLELVITARGRSISQYLSSHRNEPTEEDADCPLFETQEGDSPGELIVEWVNRIGNRWKRFTEMHATRFPARERLQIKHRAKFLIGNLGNASGMAVALALAEVEVAPAQGNEQGRFDLETFSAVTEERPPFARALDAMISNLNVIETFEISVARTLNFG